MIWRQKNKNKEKKTLQSVTKLKESYSLPPPLALTLGYQSVSNDTDEKFLQFFQAYRMMPYERYHVKKSCASHS